MSLRWASLVLASILVLSGCVAANPQGSGNAVVKRQAEHIVIPPIAPAALHSLEAIKPFVTTAKDGIKLQGHVYIPNGTGPFPVVLEYSPYWNTANDPSDSHVQVVQGRKTMTGYHAHFLDAGYAVALVNLRGTGISSGCFQWGALTDLDDIYLVVETLAHEPYSNGKIGMIGLSYSGWTQYMALASAPPSLKAVVPASGVIDLYTLLTRNGAPLLEGSAVSTLWNTEYSLGETTYPPIDSRSGEARHTECGPRYAQDVQEGVGLQTVGDRNAYWDARDIRPKVAQSKVPIFFTNGLTDGEGHIFQFDGLWDLISTKDKRMLIGQWPHGYAIAPPTDFWDMAVAWMDRYLRDGPPYVTPGVVEYQDSAKGWHATDRWPPAFTTSGLFLSDHAIVGEQGDVKASTQTFQSVYQNPSISDCKTATGTQAVFVSPPLASDVLLAGNFWVNLTVTSTMPDGNFAAYLYKTTASGACGDAGAVEVRHALTDLRHATFQAKGADFPVGTPTTMQVRSHPFATPIKAGERLVLVIGGESMELQPDQHKPALTVTTGSGVVGSLDLPVIEGTLAFR